MSIYTAIEATTSANIYFLNDKNIVQGVSATSISNAIPAYDTFKEKYEELSTYDENLSSYSKNLSTEIINLSTSLSTSVDQICANISTDLSNEITARINAVSNLSTSLSATTNKEFVHISGDTIKGSLTVTDKIETPKAILGTVEISDTLSIATDKKVLIGKASSDYSNTFVWNATDDNYTAESIDGKGGTFNINPLHQAEGFYIGEKSLSAIISEDTEITAKAIRDEIEAVSVLLTGDYALSSDVSSEISEIYSKKYLASENFDFKYDGNIIWLTAGSNILSIDAADFIKDGMLSTVELTTYAVGSEAHQALKFVFNTDQEQDPIFVDLNKLVDVYTGSEGIEINDYKVTLDFNVVGRKENIDTNTQNIKNLSNTVNTEISTNIKTNTKNIETIQKYVDDLSTGGTGIIWTLSNNIEDLSTNSIDIDGRLNKVEIYTTDLSTKDGIIDVIETDISTLKREIRNNATFCEHININPNDKVNPIKDKTLSGLFEHYGLVNVGSNPKTLKNGNIYHVSIFEIDNDSELSDKVNASFTTDDGFKLVHGDYIVIHSHDKSYVELTDLINCVEIIPSVRFDEFNKLSARADTNFMWLAGNNNQDATWIDETGKLQTGHAISGNNYFLSRNDIEDLSVKTLSADWSEVKHPNGYSLYNLSVDLSNKIYIDADDIKGTSDLSIIKLSKKEFDEKIGIERESLSSNVIYFVNSDYIDAYGQVLCNLVMTNDDVPSDATNKHYVDSICSDISTTTKLSVEELQRQIISNDNDIKYLSDEHDILSTQLSNEITSLSTSLSTSVDQICANISTDLSNEITARIKAVSDLSTSLSTSVDQICANISTDLRNEITARNKAVSDLSTSLSNTVKSDYVLKTQINDISGNAVNEATKYVNTIRTSLSDTVKSDYVLKTQINDISGNAVLSAKNYTNSVSGTINNQITNINNQITTLTNNDTKIVNALKNLKNIETKTELTDIVAALKAIYDAII